MKPFKRQVIILFGPPGSGKGTQANLLSEKLNLYYLETSKILENGFSRAKKNDFIKIGKGKYYFKKEQKENWEKGKLCSPPFVLFLVQKRVKEVFEAGKNLILAGSPRTLYEAERFTPFLKKLYGAKNIKVINIKVSARSSIYRNTRRRICQLMRHPIVWSLETAKLKKCPLDGSKLIKRGELDKPEVIKIRLEEDKKLTFPILNFMKRQGLKIKEINGEGTVEAVFRKILKVIK